MQERATSSEINITDVMASKKATLLVREPKATSLMGSNGVFCKLRLEGSTVCCKGALIQEKNVLKCFMRACGKGWMTTRF